MSDHPTETAYIAGVHFFNQSSRYETALRKSKEYEDSDAFMDGWGNARDAHHESFNNILESIS